MPKTMSLRFSSKRRGTKRNAIIIFILTYFLVYKRMASFYSWGYREDSCGSLEPPFETRDEASTKKKYSSKY